MSTRRALLHSIVAASLPVVGTSPLASALFGLRVSSPAVVFLAALSLLPSKPLSPPSPSPITPVVVQSRVPRKSLILSLLSLAALSFLVDGLAYVAYALLNGVWRHGTGVELAAFLGLTAYIALAALGAYKDVNNIEIWSRKRVKAAVFVALALDIAQVVLLVLSVTTHDPSHICNTSKSSVCIPEALHFFTPLFRVLFLLPLFFVLLYPQVIYLPAQSQSQTSEAENAPLVGQSGVLLQQDGFEAVVGTETSKYGTFAQGQSESSPAVSRPQCESSLATLWRMLPYVSPAKGLIALTVSLHILTRVLTPLIPLFLGTAFAAFHSSAPILTPFGTSPYTCIFVFALLQFLVSNGGIPNITKTLVSRLGAGADDLLSSRYTDQVLGLSLGSGKLEASDDLRDTARTAMTTVLQACSMIAAAVDDILIGVVVLAVLFGWEFGLILLLALGICGYVVCLASRPPVLTAYPGGSPTLVFMQALVSSGALLFGSLYIAKGVTEGIWSTGYWIAWVWYWGVLFLPLSWMPSFRIATSKVGSVFRVLDQPVKVLDGRDSFGGADGVEVKFDNVSFAYPYTDTQEPVSALSGVSFVLPASSVTAIVNVSGSSKSSILKVLFRLYDIDSGSIRLNGIPIHTIALGSLRSIVAAIPDVPSEDRVEAVSRALRRDAKVVLVEGALEPAIIDGRTVVWETTGLTGVDNTDQIIVIKDDQLVESGSFKELVQADGVFASLWAHYISSSAPVPGSSSVAASGVAEGYDASIINAQAVDSQTIEVPVVEGSIPGSPHTVAASIRGASVRPPTASIRAPSIKPAASIQADSVAPSVPTKDIPSVSFPSAPEESVPIAFPASSDAAATIAFPTASAPPVAFPKTDDSRSIDSGSQAHVRLPTSITFDTTATPPRVSTPDPTGASTSPPAPDSEGKRRRISSQNFQRLARRISLSTPKKGAIPNIPGIAGIAGVLRRDASLKTDKGESGVRESTDAAGGSSSAPETARNSGEMSTERTERDKEREEKKRKRKSFMEVVSGMRGESSSAAPVDNDLQGPSGDT